MLKLIIANKNLSSWSLRPWILLKMLNISFDEELVPFSQNDDSFLRFRQFSPTGKVPCLIDKGRAIWDSLAICEYIAEIDEAAWPQDRIARAWARSATAEMHSGFLSLRKQCPMNCLLQSEVKKVDDELGKDLVRIREVWESGLDQFSGPFLAGNKFTIVDAFYIPIAIRIRNYQLPISTKCEQWIDMILSQPSMQEWIASAQEEDKYPAF